MALIIFEPRNSSGSAAYAVDYVEARALFAAVAEYNGQGKSALVNVAYSGVVTKHIRTYKVGPSSYCMIDNQSTKEITAFSLDSKEYLVKLEDYRRQLAQLGCASIAGRLGV